MNQTYGDQNIKDISSKILHLISFILGILLVDGGKIVPNALGGFLGQEYKLRYHLDI